MVVLAGVFDTDNSAIGRRTSPLDPATSCPHSTRTYQALLVEHHSGAQQARILPHGLIGGTATSIHQENLSSHLVVTIDLHKKLYFCTKTIMQTKGPLYADQWATPFFTRELRRSKIIKFQNVVTFDLRHVLLSAEPCIPAKMADQCATYTDQRSPLWGENEESCLAP